VPTLENEVLASADVIFVDKWKNVLSPLKKYKIVGYNEFKTSAHLADRMRQLKLHIKPVNKLIQTQRLVKDNYEIQEMKKAAKITKHVLEKVSGEMYGRSEKQVAAEIEILFKRHFAESAFPAIVAAGKNATFIHHVPSDRIIKKGEPVLMDIGAKFSHYCADFTRTFVPKGLKEEKKIHASVHEMQENIMDHMLPGVAFANIQKLYTILLKKRGYRQFHSFGHSIGLETHEPAPLKFKENMVFTVEPGYYENSFGCRIEDMIIIKKNGAVFL
jgi:Xaa-Pro aminopeptidase